MADYHGMAMDVLQPLKEYLQYIVAIVSAAAALLPFLTRSEARKFDRWLIALIAGLLSILLWPVGFEKYCAGLTTYSKTAILLVILCVAAYLGQRWLRLRFGHAQLNFTDRDKGSTTILGGPTLTSEAQKLLDSTPLATTQDIFEELGCNPDRMWEQETRGRLVLIDTVLDILFGSAVILAIVAVCARQFSIDQVERRTQSLEITPSANQKLMIPGARTGIPFSARVSGCDTHVTWSLVGPAGRQSEWGDIDRESGIYTAPDRIDRPLDVYVIATWASQKEKQQVTVSLRSSPGYTNPHVAEAPDDRGNPVGFVVHVIDQTYSWTYGEVTLDGPEVGPMFARRMAEDGLFDGYERIICVGAASRQYVKSPALQETLAVERAHMLADWVRNAVQPRYPRVHELKIGRYNSEIRLSAEETAQERQIVIVGVRDFTPGADLKSALRRAFDSLRAEAPILGTYVDHYPESQWILDPPRH